VRRAREEINWKIAGRKRTVWLCWPGRPPAGGSLERFDFDSGGEEAG